MPSPNLYKVIAPFGVYQIWTFNEQEVSERYKLDYPNQPKPFIYLESSSPQNLDYEDLKVLYLNAATWKLIKAVDKMIEKHVGDI